MSMLLQQIRRATYSRRGTTPALAPPHTFSRFCATNNRATLAEKEETLMNSWGENVFKNGLAISFVCGTFYWVDYGGLRKKTAEWKKLHAEYDEERKLYYDTKKELDDLREKLKGTSSYNWSVVVRT